MSTEFWFGIALSVPVGIATGLMTTPVQGWLDRYNNKRSLRKTRNIQVEFERVSGWKSDPNELTHYLLYITIQIAFVGAVIGMLSGFLFALTEALDTLEVGAPYIPFRITGIFSLLGQILATLGTLLVIAYCRKGLNAWYRTKNYNSYKESVAQYVPAQQLSESASKSGRGPV